jgi:hypothetical protein
VATISTTSVYTSQINETYPVAGQNNTTQGLRDNFKNIKNALISADSDISSLKLNSINLNNATNNFNYNVIQSAVLESVVDHGVDNTGTPYDGDISVDFTQGSYQKFNLNGGIHTVTVNNWPTTSETNGLFKASVTLYFSAASLNDTYISFPSNYTNIGPSSIPYQVGPAIDNGGPWLFEVTYDGEFTTVRQVTEYAVITATNTTTHVISIGYNLYTTGTHAETIVAFNNQFGSIALLPTVITATVVQLTLPSDSIVLDSVTNISIGATIFSPASTATFTVKTVSTSSSTVVTNETLVGGEITIPSILTFVNPTFTQQPTVMQLDFATPSNGVISGINEIPGNVYTDGTGLYITYANYISGVQNKMLISADSTPNPKALGDGSTATTQSYSDSSNLVATTEYVNNVVYNSTLTVNSSTYSLLATSSTYAQSVSGVNSNGYGNRTVSYGGPTGGNDGDVWYQII